MTTLTMDDQIGIGETKKGDTILKLAVPKQKPRWSGKSVKPYRDAHVNVKRLKAARKVLPRQHALKGVVIDRFDPDRRLTKQRRTKG
ncbi:MAG: hypothetical protein AAFX87_22760 [Bacteroidota bacterium]